MVSSDLRPFRRHLDRLSANFILSYLLHILNMNSLACIRSNVHRAASRSISGGSTGSVLGGLFFTHFAVTPFFARSLHRFSELVLFSASRHVSSVTLLVFRRLFRISLSWSLKASAAAGSPCLRFICFLRYFTSLNFSPRQGPGTPQKHGRSRLGARTRFGFTGFFTGSCSISGSIGGGVGGDVDIDADGDVDREANGELEMGDCGGVYRDVACNVRGNVGGCCNVGTGVETTIGFFAVGTTVGLKHGRDVSRHMERPLGNAASVRDGILVFGKTDACLSAGVNHVRDMSEHAVCLYRSTVSLGRVGWSGFLYMICGIQVLFISLLYCHEFYNPENTGWTPYASRNECFFFVK